MLIKIIKYIKIRKMENSKIKNKKKLLVKHSKKDIILLIQ